MTRQEKIVCSAIKVTGVSLELNDIYLGVRHGDCFHQIAKRRKLLKLDDSWRVKMLRNNEQGFITTKNRFVSRGDAMGIARMRGQVISQFGSGGELYSENIY